MRSRLLSAALLAVSLAGIAAAQEAAPSPLEVRPANEFDRASSGTMSMLPKRGGSFSGSLSASVGTTGSDNQGSSRGYGGTFGGPVVPDKMWFFGSVEGQQATMNPGTVAQNAMTTNALSAHANGTLGDRQSLSAMFAQTPGYTPAGVTLNAPAVLPTSFLSLHSTSILSPNAFFTVSASKSSTRSSDIFVNP